ncbi:MAG: glycosyltransferase family 4 protein [Candidatus Caenarcaniphilales bacterium]|nr:glycosyltransferase family 4 protein [Candidatus Caenarcaniphilales bacterium]
MRRVLQVITLAECGGAQKHLLEVISGLKTEYEFCVLTGQEGYLTDELKELNVKYQIVDELVRPINPVKDFICFIKIKNFIKQYEPDVIHCHSSKAGILGRLAAWFCKKPSIFTAHGWAFHPKINFMSRTIAILTETICSWLSYKIVCVSYFDAELCKSISFFNKKIIQVIHNGISPVKEAQSEQTSRLNNEKVKILMVGRFAVPKRQNLLIQAFNGLKTELKNKAKLYFAGDGVTKTESEKLVQKYGLNSSVQFLGEISPIDTLLQEMDIFALISDREGLPISIIEAMKHEIPIIASDVGGVKELVKDGINGFLVNARTEITEKLAILITNSSLRKEMSERNKVLFEQNLTSDKMLERIKQLYG